MSENTDIQQHNKDYDAFKARYDELAKVSRRGNRRMMNHICIRVDDIDETEKLLSESFGISSFIRLDGKLFEGEKKLSLAWVGEEIYLELMEPTEQQDLGYDTGCGPAIGHLSEIGFFTPDMDKELAHLGKLGWEITDAIEEPGRRMIKIDTNKPSGFPVELIEIVFDEEELK